MVSPDGGAVLVIGHPILVTFQVAGGDVSVPWIVCVRVVWAVYGRSRCCWNGFWLVWNAAMQNVSTASPRYEDDNASCNEVGMLVYIVLCL